MYKSCTSLTVYTPWTNQTSLLFKARFREFSSSSRISLSLLQDGQRSSFQMMWQILFCPNFTVTLLHSYLQISVGIYYLIVCSLSTDEIDPDHYFFCPSLKRRVITNLPFREQRTHSPCAFKIVYNLHSLSSLRRTIPAIISIVSMVLFLLMAMLCNLSGERVH